jgi:hypothetical protein
VPPSDRDEVGRFPGRQTAVVIVLLLAIVILPSPARAGLDILPLDQVRPGMHGIGRTVFSGGLIEEFGIEVVDVVRGTRPKGSLILFRGTGETLEHAGIIAGMSGSPVYIDGKLAGAVAFAYPFVKDPIGGITPIEEMLELDRYPLPDARDIEAMESGPAGNAGSAGSPPGGGTEGAGPKGSRKRAAGIDNPTDGDPTHGDPTDDESTDDDPADDDPTAQARAAGNPVGFANLWSAFTRGGDAPRGGTPTEMALAIAPGMASSITSEVEAYGARGGLSPIPIPLAFTGWTPVLLDAARGPVGRAGFLAMEGVIPVAEQDAAGAAGVAGVVGAAGATNSASPDESATFQPGSAIALELVGGDATIAAIGTVTAVDGDRVYAFGHPMVQGGPVAFPMFGARIHTVMPSLQLSTKMGSPTKAMGGVWQDRRSGVLGLLGAVPPTIPVRVSVSLPGRTDEIYRYRIVRDPILSPMLLPWTVSNSYQHSGWLQGETTARAEVVVSFDGGRTVRRRDLVVTDAPALTLGGGAVLPASLLLTNPYQRVRLDSLSVRITAEPGHAAAEVTRLRCTPRRVAPGDTLRVEITLQPWRGSATTRTERIVIPAGWEGKRLRVTAAGSGEVLEWDRDRAPGKWSPRDLADLVRMVETLPSAGSLLLRVTSRDPGALVRGRELPGLPGSLLLAGSESGDAASIRPAAGTVLDERVLDTPWDITGRETAEVEITR